MISLGACFGGGKHILFINRKCRRAPLCYDCTVHIEAECEFYRKSNLDINFLFNHFDVVTPVRCLLLAETDPEKFNEVMKMEAHLEERRGTEIWNIHGKHTVQPLLECGAFERFGAGVKVNEEVIQQICGVLDVNSFEIRGDADEQDGQMSNTVRGLYPKTALMTHSCVPNTLVSVDGNSSLRLYTTVAVKEGELLYYNYTRCLFVCYSQNRFSLACVNKRIFPLRREPSNGGRIYAKGNTSSARVPGVKIPPNWEHI